MKPRLISLIWLLLVLALGASLSAPTPSSQPAATSKPAMSQEPAPAPGFYNVIEVVDGDTLSVDMQGTPETVRLIGIDTPETHDPRKPVQCFGQAAAAEAARLVGEATVRLEADSLSQNRDKYRRLLRYVYLADNRLLNAELVAGGYAFAYTIFPYEKLEEFRALETRARAENKGLWAGCQVNESSQVKQTQPAQ